MTFSLQRDDSDKTGATVLVTIMAQPPLLENARALKRVLERMETRSNQAMVQLVRVREI